MADADRYDGALSQLVLKGRGVGCEKRRLLGRCESIHGAQQDQRRCDAATQRKDRREVTVGRDDGLPVSDRLVGNHFVRRAPQVSFNDMGRFEACLGQHARDVAGEIGVDEVPHAATNGCSCPIIAAAYASTSKMSSRSR